MIGAQFFCIYHALFSTNVQIFAVLLAKFGYHMKVLIFGVLLRNLAITFIENGIYSSGDN